MPLTFSAAERLAITRRMVRIDQENAAFATTASAFNTQQAQLLQVDVGNTKFYDYYNNICIAYEIEYRQISGMVAATYLPSDIVDCAKNPTIEPFYPISPLPAYTRAIPLIQDGSFTNNRVKGVFHPASTDSRYEQNILSNAAVYDGLTEMIFRLENGITGASTATATTSDAIPSGPVAGQIVTVDDATNFVVNELVYINLGASSGIYKITAKTPTQLTLTSIVHSLTGIGSGASVKNTVAAFNSTERQNITSTLYQEIITNITNRIAALVLEWETKVDAQIAIVNGDERTPQAAEIVAALADVNNTKSIIDTWQALPNTGSGAKYTSSGISPVSAEITARQSFLTARLSQILTAFGGSSANSLSQSGDSYTSAALTNPYYLRYKWLNFRINRTTGSLRRYYSAEQSKDTVNGMSADNTAIKAEYSAYFVVKAVAFNDGTDILHLKDVVSLSNGNTLTVLSETQPEISRTIVQVMGTTQVKLNAPVPKTYTLEDLARVFKTL